MKKILFVAGGPRTTAPNDFHYSLAKSLGAPLYVSNINVVSRLGFLQKIINTLKSALLLPRDYDIYLSETVFIVPAIAKSLGLLKKDAMIINISADPVLYDLVYHDKYTISDRAHKHLINYVDGFVMVGEWGFLLKKLGINVPYIEVPAGVSDIRADQLLKKKIDIKARNHNIVFVGSTGRSMNSSTRTRYKGFDILLEAFKEINANYPDSKLYLLGDNDQNKDNKNIISTGFKDGQDFVDLLGNMSVAAYVARGDTFPVGSIEAMMAGVPTFVSEFTGTKIIVEKVGKRGGQFVLPISSKKLAQGVMKYFKLPDNKKLNLSKQFREAARPYLVRNTTRIFPKKFKTLVKHIEEGRRQQIKKAD